MNLLETRIECPHCWQSQTFFVDPSEEHQHYYEDCHVCCKPIEVELVVDDFGVKWVHVEESWA